MNFASAGLAAAHFAALIEEIHEAQRHALEKAAKVVEHEAKAEIGTYQGAAGPFAAWAPLAPSTVADRTAKGFTPDDPLLRTGGMRDSIEHTVRMNRLEDGEAHIGSDDDKAVWQELGTHKIPPRSFLGGAAYRKEHEVRKIIGHEVVAAIAGQKVF